jgi:hypothetical protein
VQVRPDETGEIAVLRSVPGPATTLGAIGQQRLQLARRIQPPIELARDEAIGAPAPRDGRHVLPIDRFQWRGVYRLPHIQLGRWLPKPRLDCCGVTSCVILALGTGWIPDESQPTTSRYAWVRIDLGHVKPGPRVPMITLGKCLNQTSEAAALLERTRDVARC